MRGEEETEGGARRQRDRVRDTPVRHGLGAARGGRDRGDQRRSRRRVSSHAGAVEEPDHDEQENRGRAGVEDIGEGEDRRADQHRRERDAAIDHPPNEWSGRNGGHREEAEHEPDLAGAAAELVLEVFR
jgi:hypothetical protein